MKKRTLMAIFAALTLSATMAAATSCDMLAGLPIIGDLIGGSSVEEKLPHAIKWNYDSALVTITPVDATELPTQLMEEEEFTFRVTVKDGYTLGNVSGAKKQDDGSYKLTMAKRDVTINVTVNKTLNELVVEAPALTYFEGQTVDTSLLKVTAKYELGDEIITDYTISYENGSAFEVGDTKFTVSFGGKSVDVELAKAVESAQEFHSAKLVVENDVVYLVAEGNYNAAGTVEEAAATVKGWFNDCTERGTWAGMTYNVDVDMKEDKSFTVKANIEGMTPGRQYYFHIKEGKDGQNFFCSFANGVVPVTGTDNNDDYTIAFPEEGEATFVETSDGTKYYIGTIPNWGDPVIIICPINEAAPTLTGMSLELVDGTPYVVVNGTCKAGLDADAAEKLVLNLVKHLDFEDIKNGNVKVNNDSHINDSAFVEQGKVVDEEGNVTTPGTIAAKITYDAEAGTFKIYAALAGANVVDGAVFFGHYGTLNTQGYYTNMGLEPDTSTITANGLVFAFATAEDVGLTESWQSSITYITVTAAE